jgi:transposase
MLYDLLQTKHIYIVCGKTDLRKGIDGLASLIQQEYQLELYEDAVFYFAREPSRPFQTSLLGR